MGEPSGPDEYSRQDGPSTSGTLAGIRRLGRVETAVRRGAFRMLPYTTQDVPDHRDETNASSAEPERSPLDLGRTARTTAVVTLVGLAIVVLALALWKIRLT